MRVPVKKASTKDVMREEKKGTTHGKSPCTPRSPAPDLVQTHQCPERGRVTQGHVDESVMRKGAHGRQGRALLSSSLGSGGDENPNVFTIEAAGLPLLAGLIPEGFPLGGEGAVTGRDPEEESVVFFELVGGDEGDGAGLAGCVHLGEDFLREGLFDSVGKWGNAGQLQCLSTIRGEWERPRALVHCGCKRSGGPTGKRRRCLRRPQCRPSQLRQSWRYDRTWNTVSIESANCSNAGGGTDNGSEGFEDERRRWPLWEPCLRMELRDVFMSIEVERKRDGRGIWWS